MSEVAEQLQELLPASTGLFNDTVAIDTVSVSSGVCLVDTSQDHGLFPGQIVALARVETRTPLSSATQNGMITTFMTSSDHDLTEGNPDTETVPLTGFTDPSWNGSHVLAEVANRRSFSIRAPLSAPVLNGAEVLLEPDRIDGINGLYEITSASGSQFSISTPGVADGSYTPVMGVVASSPRIYVAATLERAREVFDQGGGGFCCFVVPSGGVVSKDRATDSDAISARTPGNSLRIKLLDTFSVFVFAPVSDQLSAEEAIDLCVDEALGAIVKSIFGTRFSTPFACDRTEFRIIFTGHEPFSYDRSVLVYQYLFEAPVDLSSDDAVFARSRAFRDVGYTQFTGTQQLTVLDIDIDKEPI